jgi:hypothetical protein
MRNKIRLFFFGIIAAFAALFFELFLYLFFPQTETIETDKLSLFLILAAFVEEFFKFIVIWQSLKKPSNKKNFFSNSTIIGLGFVFTEIFLFSKIVDSSFPSLLLGLTGLIIIHTATAIFFGYAIVKFDRLNMIKFAVPVIFLGLLLHLIYNGLIIYEYPDLWIIIYLLFLIILEIFINFSHKMNPGKANG